MKKIAYLGIAGSYSYIGAIKFFKGKNTMTSCHNIRQIFDKVENNVCDFGIVPLENSTTGGITASYDELSNNKLSIIGEIIMHIHHNLLVKESTINLTDIHLCLSHEQAINQCNEFFINNRKINNEFVSDTATAAETVSKSKRMDIAAIASLECSKLYNLKILKRKIEDNPTNFTRFVIIGKNSTNLGNKASLIFSVAHIPGSLLETLKPYAKYGLNLTKIESRPVFGKPWEYLFLLDLEFGDKKNSLIEAIDEMKENVNFIKLLGIYNKGKIYES